MSDSTPLWFIGQHESKRTAPLTDHTLRAAKDANYDMLTTPITTPQFQYSVQAILSTHYSRLSSSLSPADVPIPLIPPLKPSDTPLLPTESLSGCIAFASPWIDLASPDPVISSISRQVLNLELAYASFCGISNVVITGPAVSSSRSDTVQLAQYARAILQALSISPYLQFFILFPISPGKGKRSQDASHLSRFAQVTQSDLSVNSAELDQWAPWEAWDLIRSVCKYSLRLSVALELPRQLPSMTVQSKWFSEPVRLLLIPDSSFIPNKVQQPVLTTPHKALLTRYMRLRHAPWILLSDVGPVPTATESVYANGGSSELHRETSPAPTPAEAARMSRVEKVRNDTTPHLSYLRWLQREQPAESIMHRFGAGYKDYLQAPLQPLADNLESITYETFEKDPVKYEWYEQAIILALRDWSELGKTSSSASGAVVVAVAGAGRGPLVTRALRASQQSGVPIELYAVEKNPNAFVLLQRHNQTAWGGQVTVVKSDMRAWQGPVQADGSITHVDIIISELLGSFADNELSPECLDGVQHVLNPTHGISIPESYTAHITPIATPRLYADLLSKSATDKDSFEIPHVVMFHQFEFLAYLPSSQEDAEASSSFKTDPSTEPSPIVLPCWEFTHPIPAVILDQSATRRAGGRTGGSGGLTGGDGWNDHNARFAQLAFPCSTRGICHGLAGYFETVLYSSPADGMTVELSTNPLTMESKSKDMISWFPIFFPLKQPLHFPDDAELVVSVWRNTDDRKVWYEWMVEAGAVVEGPGGSGRRRVRLGISELHSSKNNGCLM